MKSVDAFLISGFERFSHWTQRTVGITCVRLAALLMVVVAIFLISACVLAPSKIPGLLYVFLICGGRTFGLASREADAFERVAKGMANPLKAKWLSRGILLAVLLLFTVLFWNMHPVVKVVGLRPDHLVIYGLWFTPLSEYFEACDPLPPGTSKVRQWLDSLKRSLHLVTEPAGA